MAGDAALKVQLTRWFQTGDQLAHRRAYEDLVKRLFAPREVVHALGGGAVDDVRQDVLAKLLARDSSGLRDALSPAGFALKAWRNALSTELRKWGPRTKRADEVGAHLRQVTARYDVEGVERQIDAGRAIEIAESLGGKGRLAVLLTTRPDRISDTDWRALVADLPPPPPVRPSTAIEREEASMLLYPPGEREATAARNQRLNSFDKTYKRATAAIRAALEENE